MIDRNHLFQLEVCKLDDNSEKDWRRFTSNREEMGVMSKNMQIPIMKQVTTVIVDQLRDHAETKNLSS